VVDPASKPQARLRNSGDDDRIHTYSEYLGNEIVIALSQGQHAPLILAEVKRPGFREFLQQRISE